MYYSIYIKLYIDELQREIESGKYNDQELQVLKQVYNHIKSTEKMSYFIEKFINKELTITETVNGINSSNLIKEIK
jgi:hypothetical protein